MAAPNIAGSSVAVNGKTYTLAPTNTETDIIAAVATGHCIRVEAVMVSNIHATNDGWITLVHKRGGNTIRVPYQLPVPVGATFNILDGEILYLEEGDSLRMTANASSYLEAWATGEDIF